MSGVSHPRSAIVTGDGVIGLSVSLHLAARGVHVTLLAPRRPGAASWASAGMMAPSIERTEGVAQQFGDAARDAWPRMASLVAGRGVRPFAVHRDGILRIAASSIEADALRATLRGSDQWLDATAVASLEPGLAPTAGGALFVDDGMVDVHGALDSLQAALRTFDNVRVVEATLNSVRRAPGLVTAGTSTGDTFDAQTFVLAAGAWSGLVAGLPRAVPVFPIRGSVVSVPGAQVRRPVYSAAGHAYFLPRGDSTLIGATADDVGFDTSFRPSDAKRLIAAAVPILPGIASLPVSPPLTGLRPVTSDRLPILGPDPDWPEFIYACGHGRNGFLHAPLTGEVVADLVLNGATEWPISVFSVGRFSANH